MKWKLYFFLIFIFLNNSNIHADNIKHIGEVFWILLPSTAYGSTFILDDQIGRDQFYKSFSSTLLITYALKYSTNKDRPNGEKYSFPSNHTSSSFQSASFIQMRYGWKYGILTYIVASFVGYSRVKSNEHYTIDVIAGAILGITSSYCFTTPYENLKIKPNFSKKYTGLNITYQW